jgi:hypothetical protein
VDTIMESNNILDFCVAKRTDDKFVNEFHYIKDREKQITTLQKTLRFYMSTNGGMLYKKDPKDGKLISYCISSPVTILNDVIEMGIKDYHINYNHYIKECNKIINLIKCKQLTLF